MCVTTAITQWEDKKREPMIFGYNLVGKGKLRKTPPHSSSGKICCVSRGRALYFCLTFRYFGNKFISCLRVLQCQYPPNNLPFLQCSKGQSPSLCYQIDVEDVALFQSPDSRSAPKEGIGKEFCTEFLLKFKYKIQWCVQDWKSFYSVLDGNLVN